MTLIKGARMGITKICNAAQWGELLLSFGLVKLLCTSGALNLLLLSFPMNRFPHEHLLLLFPAPFPFHLVVLLTAIHCGYWYILIFKPSRTELFCLQAGSASSTVTQAWQLLCMELSTPILTCICIVQLKIRQWWSSALKPYQHCYQISPQLQLYLLSPAPQIPDFPPFSGTECLHSLFSFVHHFHTKRQLCLC